MYNTMPRNIEVWAGKLQPRKSCLSIGIRHVVIEQYFNVYV